MWAAATDLEGQECLSMASLATTKDHVAIWVGIQKTLHLLGTGGHQAHNKYNKYSNSQPALLNLDQFTPLHKAGLMKKKDFNSLLLCLQQMLLFAMKEQFEDRAPREPLSDLNSLFDNPKEQAEAFMVQMICKQKLQMTINQKMVLLLCMLEIIADKKVSKAYFIFLCSKKDMEQMDFKSNASKQVSKKYVNC